MVRGKPAPALTAVLAAAAAVATGPRHATGQPNYAEHSLAGAPDYGQCGGNDYAGPTTCAHEDSGTTCVYANDWYSQCIPPEGGGSGGGNVFYNLQLYAWRIESGSFQDHTCGNRWLEFYNSCGTSGYFPGGIGSCGSWGSTVDRMTQCGADNAAVAAEVRAEFCSCLQCVFVPAATRTDHPFVYLNEVCHDSPPFEVAVLALADGVCGSPTCVDSAMEDDALTSSSPSTSISTVVSTTLESDTATTTTTGSAPSATTSTTPGAPAMASTPEDRSTPLSSGTASTRAESTTMAQATTARADPSLSSSPPSTAVPTGPGVANWGQCGGSGYSGPTTCAHEDTGTACVYHHEWYSQCVPAHGSGGSDHVFYNLQLYAWRVESKYFADNTCGNRWLDFYNACGNAGYFPGGIGFCGRWGSTVDRMTQCGMDEVVDAGVQAAFCECLQCTFVPAATSAAHPYAYLDAHAHCGDVPAFEEAVLALADDVCGSRTCGSAADPDEATVHPDATAAVPVTVTGRGGGLTAAPLVTTAPPTTTATTHAPGGGVESTQGPLWGDSLFYNLQLYAWRVESRFFEDNTCGNRWLDFYNACFDGGYFPSGIGFCGKWGATVGLLERCGAEDGNGTVTQTVHDHFCHCLQCTFVPAATSTEYPYEYLDPQTCSGVPTFEDAVLQLVDSVCETRACSGSGSSRAASAGLATALVVTGAAVSGALRGGWP